MKSGGFYKVMVNKNRRISGANSRIMIVYASFRSYSDAHAFARSLKNDNPTWEVRMRPPK